MLLYIHIPFCDSKCFYCSFNSYVDKFHLKQNYMESLYKELEYELKNNKNTISTVFIGGGTPSSVNQELYAPIFTLLKGYIDNTIEITVESNPNSATQEWQQYMYDLGVNRISFGVQSFNDEKLKFLGRSHNANRAIKAIQIAKCIGFNSINCDIIYGSTMDTKELILNDLQTAKELGVHHISSYSLTLEEGTKFWDMKDICMDDEEMSCFVIESIKELGYNQYEISNFAKNNKYQSIHNLGYWEYKEYLGVGCGAVGRIGNKRYYKPKSIEEYIQNPFAKEYEELSVEDIKTEKVLLGLRSKVGVEINLLNMEEKAKLKELEEAKKITIIDGRFYNNDYLLSDEIALYLL